MNIDCVWQKRKNGQATRKLVTVLLYEIKGSNTTKRISEEHNLDGKLYVKYETHTIKVTTFLVCKG